MVTLILRVCEYKKETSFKKRQQVLLPDPIKVAGYRLRFTIIKADVSMWCVSLLCCFVAWLVRQPADTGLICSSYLREDAVEQVCRFAAAAVVVVAHDGEG